MVGGCDCKAARLVEMCPQREKSNRHNKRQLDYFMSLLRCFVCVLSVLHWAAEVGALQLPPPPDALWGPAVRIHLGCQKAWLRGEGWSAPIRSCLCQENLNIAQQCGLFLEPHPISVCSTSLSTCKSTLLEMQMPAHSLLV